MKNISINLGYFGNPSNGKRTTLKSIIETAKSMWDQSSIEEINLNYETWKPDEYISCIIKIPIEDFSQLSPQKSSELKILNAQNIHVKTYIIPERLQNELCKTLVSEADGIIFIVDAIPERFDFDKIAIYELLSFYKYEKMLAMQYNKRDISNATPINVLQETFNPQDFFLESPSIAYYKISRINGEIKLMPPDKKDFKTQLGHINLFKNLVAKIVNNFNEEELKNRIK